MDKPSTAPPERYTVSEMGLQHGRDVGRIHAEHIRHSHLSYLGPRFLGRLYETLIEQHYGFGYVLLEDDRVVGFSFGKAQHKQSTTGFVLKSWRRMTLPGIMLLFTHPIALTKVAIGLLQSGTMTHEPDVGEWLALAIIPEARRKGNAKRLTDLILDRLRREGCNRVRGAVHNENTSGIKQYHSKVSHGVIIGETRIMGQKIFWYEWDLNALYAPDTREPKETV